MADVLGALTEAVRGALKEMGAGDEAEVVVEASARPEFGDFSTPAPLRAARVLRRPPMEIAEELRTTLEQAGLELVAGWTVSPPGYVNARLRDDIWARDVITAALAIHPERPLELQADLAPAAGKILVEHTATNPNKAAHVGHLRNACIGDTVCRALLRTGQHVEINNYLDDTGAQVADVVIGIRELGIDQAAGEPFDQYCSRVYVEVSRRFEEEPALMDRRRVVLHAIEQGDPEIAPFVKEVATKVVDCHLATMARFDIAYDLLTWESDIIKLGFWQQAFELLRESGAIVLATTGKFANCWVMPPETEAAADVDDDETKVLVKSDGVATYTAKDIAYQLWKFGLLGRDFHYRPWKPGSSKPMMTSSEASDDEVAAQFGKARRVVNVIDARQAYPQQIVQRALRRLGYTQEADDSTHLAYEVVALSPPAARELGIEPEADRELYALSGRRGIEVRADDLLDRAIERLSEKALDADTARHVAAGAIRYYLLKFSLNQIIAFDFDEALRVSGDTGVYLQYAHARVAGILRKTDNDGGELIIPEGLEAVERALLHRIDAYPRTLTAAAASLSPSVLTSYAFSLAATLSDFYEHTPPIIREADVSIRRFRRALVESAGATLADALRTLGIAALERV
jgi:arginyl-tRNA synthetase